MVGHVGMLLLLILVFVKLHVREDVIADHLVVEVVELSREDDELLQEDVHGKASIVQGLNQKEDPRFYNCEPSCHLVAKFLFLGVQVEPVLCLVTVKVGKSFCHSFFDRKEVTHFEAAILYIHREEAVEHHHAVEVFADGDNAM